MASGENATLTGGDQWHCILFAGNVDQWRKCICHTIDFAEATLHNDGLDPFTDQLPDPLPDPLLIEGPKCDIFTNNAFLLILRSANCSAATLILLDAFTFVV